MIILTKISQYKICRHNLVYLFF
ncbi:MAG: hypothetical protein SCABRO_00869, partial [Candidatus Scalindua brodae]